MSTVRVNGLADAITEELRAYSEEVAEKIKENVEETAKECVKNIKLRVPTNKGGYKKGWKYKIVHKSAGDIRIVVYNARKPQIAHLLEHGHAKKGGGRVEGIPHIVPSEREAERQLIDGIKVAVRNR